MEKILVGILTKAVFFATPEIIKGVRELVADMVVKAAATENPWDDVFCGLLQSIVGKPDE